MENDQTKKTEEINKKNQEINNLKAEIDRLRSKSNVNVDLEAEMERLKKEAEDAKSEASELKAETERLRREADEAKSEVKELIRKQGFPEGDIKVRDLERKIGDLEIREVEENSRRVRVEEEMREKLAANQREIEGIRLENEEVNTGVFKQNLKIRVLELKWQVVAAGGASAAVAIFSRSYFGFGKPSVRGKPNLEVGECLLVNKQLSDWYDDDGNLVCATISSAQGSQTFVVNEEGGLKPLSP